MAQGALPGRKPGQRAGDRPFYQPLVDEAVNRLSPEEWKELRGVMSRLWQNEEVKSARDKARDSSIALRDTIRKVALQEAASLAPVIEKLMMRGLDGQGPAGPAHGDERPHRSPDGGPQGPEALMQEGLGRIGGLFMELQEKLPPEQREQLQQAMRGVRQNPEVRELAKNLANATPEERRAKMRAILETARKTLKETHPELAKALDELRSKKDGGHGDHGGSPETPPAPKRPEEGQTEVKPAGDPPAGK
jgi:uncharacterized membrane protein